MLLIVCNKYFAPVIGCVERRQHREHAHKLFSTALAIIAVAAIFAVAAFGGPQLTGYATAKTVEKTVIVSPYAANVRVDALAESDGNVVAVDGATPLIAYFNAAAGRKSVEVKAYAADGPVRITIFSSGISCSKAIEWVAVAECGVGSGAGEIVVQIFAENNLLKVDGVQLKVVG